MRELVLKMSLSADGFVAGVNGESDWMLPSRDPAGAAWVVETVRGASLHALGSRTFREMASYWPTATGPLAAPMSEIPKVVFSRRTGQAEPSAERSGSWASPRVANGDLAEEIARLRSEPGTYVLAHGGASFARSLAAQDLVDEYRLVVHPIVLGRGQSLFGELPAPRHLMLTSSTRFASGVIANVYRKQA